MKRYYGLLVLSLSILLLDVPSVFAQSKEIDSLKALLITQEGIELVNTLNELSWYYKGIQLDTAYGYAIAAISASNKIDSDSARSASYNSMGNVKEAMGEIDSALYYHQEAISIKTRLRDTLGIASSLNNLGILYDEMGKYPQALSYYFQALAYYEQYDENESIAMVLLNIGIVYKKQEAYEKVLSYYLRARDIYQKTGNTFGQVVLSGNIGSIHINLKNYDSVIYYSQKAVAGYRDLGFLRYVPYAQHNLAIANDSLGNVQATRDYYFSAIEGHQDFSNDFELANVYTSLSNHFLTQQDYPKATTYAELGLRHAEEVKANELSTQLYEVLAKSQASQGSYQEAFDSYQNYVIGKDSIYEAEKIKQIFELETVYETEKKEQQIALQQAQLSEEKARNQISLLVIFGLSTFLLLSVFLILSVRSRARKKQLLTERESELRLKETQLEAGIKSQEEERSRFAKDLHDGFGQMISVLNLNLKSLEEAKVDRHEAFQSSSEVLDQMYKNLKEICFDLMPETLIKSGLPEALNEFAARINKTGQIHISTNFFGMKERLEDIQEVSLFRVTQEWVNNVLKHGSAGHVTIQITREKDEVNLLIEDDGPGFDAKLLTQSKKGNGWKNIQSRVNLIKGKLALDTLEGRRGSTLIIDFEVAYQHIASSSAVH